MKEEKYKLSFMCKDKHTRLSVTNILCFTHSTKQQKSDSPTSSYQSLKSDRSIPLPLNLSGEAQKNIKRFCLIKHLQRS